MEYRQRSSKYCLYVYNQYSTIEKIGRATGQAAGVKRRRRRCNARSGRLQPRASVAVVLKVRLYWCVDNATEKRGVGMPAGAPTIGALDRARETVMATFDLGESSPGVFWGEWGPVEGRRTLESRSPIDGRPLGTIATADVDDYERVVLSAQEAFKEWARVPAPRRGEIVKLVADELAGRKTELGLLVSLEVGKTVTEGLGEIQEMIDIAHFAVGLSRQLYGLTIASERPDHRLQEQWHPLGPVAVITAFNFPSAVWAWNALIAAVTGDTVVWKPSSEAPLTAIAVTKVVNAALEKAGAPPIFSLMIGSGRSIGDRVLSDRRMPLVSFTGSVPTGRHVAEVVAKRLGRTILELGGNNAAVVTPRADLAVALKGVAFGALATAGQRCTSTRRLILHESIYSEFLAELEQTYSGVSSGRPVVALDAGRPAREPQSGRRHAGRGGSGKGTGRPRGLWRPGDTGSRVGRRSLRAAYHRRSRPVHGDHPGGDVRAAALRVQVRILGRRHRHPQLRPPGAFVRHLQHGYA